MSKIVYVCIRDATKASPFKQRVLYVVPKLVPDNIPTAPCRFAEYGNINYGISTYSESTIEKNGSVCVGMVYPGPEKWWQPLDGHPDGSFAIFRSNDTYVELLTDIAASRTIWYYKDDKVFIAGTSQRAVIAVAGNFEFDKRVIPWVLSSGTLGPSFGWCKNISRVEPNGSLLLNRQTWKLSTHTIKADYSPNKISDKEHEEQLKEVLVDSFSNLDLDFSKWILPISGGFDSRGIACLLKKTGKDISHLKTLTWGLKASLQDEKTDAYVGGALAQSLGLEHNFFEIDHIDENIENIFSRYISCSEGRIDHITGYTDGFATWKGIFETGTHGIIRGDESFGWQSVFTSTRCRVINDLTLLSDFSNFEILQKNGFDKQQIPSHLLKRDGESYNTWADRLYDEFTLPVMMAALNDIKLSYAEVVNPLLSSKIIMHLRTMPDHLRKNKLIFRKFVKELSPDVNFATKDSTGEMERILDSPGAVQMMSAELSSAYMTNLYPEEFIEKIIDCLHKPAGKNTSSLSGTIKQTLKNNMPSYLKEKLSMHLQKPFIDNSLIAFRMYMTGKMYRMLAEDVKESNMAKYLTPA